MKTLMEDAEFARFHGHGRNTYKATATAWAKDFLPSLKPKTANRYKQSARQLSPWFKDLLLEQISRKRIAGYVRDRKKGKVSNATIRRDLTVLSSICRYAAQQGWLERNPVPDYDRSMISEKRDPIILPLHPDIDFTLDRSSGTLGKLCRFLLCTGMRRDEAVYLRRQQIDFGACQAVLHDTKSRVARTITLEAPAMKIINALPVSLTSPFVFRSARGTPYKNASSQFGELSRSAQKSAQETGLEFRRFRLHDLRHRFAVDYLKNGGNIYDLQRILGHSSIITTELYLAFLTVDEQQTAMRTPAQNPAHIHRFTS